MCTGTACFVTAPHWEEGQGKSLSHFLSKVSNYKHETPSFCHDPPPNKPCILAIISATAQLLYHSVTRWVTCLLGLVWFGGVVSSSALSTSHTRGCLPAGACAHEGSAVRNISQEKPNIPSPSYCHGTHTLTEAPTIWLHLQEIINHVSKTLFLLCDANQNSHPLGH